jgi:hypothetical protein
MDKKVFYIIIVLFSASVFFFSNNVLRGYLRCDSCLGKEIQASPDSLYQYNLSNKAPFKYRVLFPTIVKTTHKVVFSQYDNLGFYYSYKFWSLFFYITATCLLFYLMTIAGFSNALSLAGAFIFVLLPPMLMAYTVPVHTREDPLAYSLLITGLIFIVKDKRWLFLFVASIAALCRETLLLLPMLYFFFAEDKLIVRRFFISGVPVLVWLTLRVGMGHELYDVGEGFRWNNNNIEQVIGFLFITFNVCWIPFLFHHLNFKKNISGGNKIRKFFFKSAWLAVSVVLLTTYFGGIFNEIRLLHILSPWMIMITLDFLEKHLREIKTGVLKIGYLIFIAACILASAVLMYVVLKHQKEIIVPGKYNIPYHLWIIVSVIYICITLIFMPISFRIFSLNRNKDA